MLQKLILENWKSHYKTEIDFQQGYNVIVGNIGSGKSSIIEAITFALFGTTQSVQSRKIQVKDLIMAKPKQMDSANITLFFSTDNNNYKVERVLYATKSSQAKLFCNDKLLRGPKPADVNDEIEKILGINIDVFMRANYSEQNQIDFFLKMPSAQRKQLFDNMFGIDFFDTVSVNARQVSNRLKEKVMGDNEILLEVKGMLKNYNFDEIKQNKENVEKKIIKEKKELSEQSKILLEVRQKESELENKRKTAESYENEIKGNLGKLELISKEIDVTKIQDLVKDKENINKIIESSNKKTQELKALKSELDKKTMLLVQNKDRIENYQKTINSNKKIIESSVIDNDIETKITEMLNKNDNVKSELKKINEDIATTKAKIEARNYELKEIIENTNKIKKIGAKCPLCEQILDENHVHKIVLDNTTKTGALEKEQIQIREILKQSNENYKLKESELSEIEKTLIKYRETLSKKSLISKIEQENKELNEKIEFIQKEIPVLEEFLKNNQNLEIALEHLALISEEKQKELERSKRAELYLELENKVQTLTEKLESIAYKKDEFENIKKSLSEIEIATNYRKTIIDQDKKLLNEYDFKLKQYTELKEKLKAIETKISEINAISDDLLVFSNVAKKTQEDVREKMIKTINEIFMDLWPKVYPYADFEQIKLDIVDGDYKLIVYFDKDYKRVLDDFVSGGERSAIALTLRIAMSLVMRNKLNLLVLDEPTHNLDENSVMALSNLFNNHLLKFVDQIFVITHDKQLEHYAQNIYYIERDKENDSPSSIERIS